MKVTINCKGIEYNVYRYNVWVNEEKIALTKDKDIKIFECPENSSVKIEICNAIFESSKSWLLFIFYWVLALGTGYGERSPFGKPVKCVLYITDTGKKDIYIKTNASCRNKIFDIITECELEVVYVWPRNYKIKWLCAIGIPVFLILLGFILILAFIEWNVYNKLIKWLFIFGFSIVELVWCMYVLKMMNNGRLIKRKS